MGTPEEDRRQYIAQQEAAGERSAKLIQLQVDLSELMKEQIAITKRQAAALERIANALELQITTEGGDALVNPVPIRRWVIELTDEDGKSKDLFWSACRGGWFSLPLASLYKNEDDAIATRDSDIPDAARLGVRITKVENWQALTS